MNEFNESIIKDYANKLLIGLTEEETKTILNEFDVIKKNMDLINEIEGIKDVEPLDYPYFTEYSFTDSEVFNESVDDVLKNADVKTDREIEVPRVVG